MFAIFTGNHLCWSLFNKVAGPQTTTLLKRDSNTGFSCKICEIFKNALFNRTSPVVASDSFAFPVCNLIKKETPQKMFFCEFCKILRISFLLIEHLGTTISCVYLWIFQNFSKFFRIILLKSTSGKLHISRTNYRISTTRYSRKISQVHFKHFMQWREVAIGRRSFT